MEGEKKVQGPLNLTQFVAIELCKGEGSPRIPKCLTKGKKENGQHRFLWALAKDR